MMKASDTLIMSILYAPASYTHHSHLPEIFLADENREASFLNFWLLRSGKLSDLPACWQPDDITCSLLLEHWHLIPIAAHLISGYLLRNFLPNMASMLMSDPRLLAFISLPLLNEIMLDVADIPLDSASCGATFISGQFPSLPDALRQRLLLHFPAGTELARFTAPKTLNHINLLRMAFNYANHYY
jgi:hypothetical protein